MDMPKEVVPCRRKYHDLMILTFKIVEFSTNLPQMRLTCSANNSKKNRIIF